MRNLIPVLTALTLPQLRSYERDVCHSRFTQSNSLKAHKVIHAGKRTRSLQKVHQKNDYVAPPTPVRKNHACPQCTKVFCHMGSLVRHLVVHDAKQKNAAIQPEPIQVINGTIPVVQGSLEEMFGTLTNAQVIVV